MREPRNEIRKRYDITGINRVYVMKCNILQSDAERTGAVRLVVTTVRR